MNKFWVFLMLLVLIGYKAFGQIDCLNKQVTFGSDDQTPESVIELLSAKSGCRFSYSPDALALKPNVTFPEATRTVRDVLDLVLKKHDFNYEETASQVIIYPIRKNKVTLNGHVRDSATDEFLIGANIYLSEVSSGVSTNSYGFYSISLPPGEYLVQCTHLGYSPFTSRIFLPANRSMDITLAMELTTLEAVEILANSEATEEVGTQELSTTRLKTMPALGGETDVIKSIQLLPGVKTLGEGSSGFFVRGGDIDQNLILLDEAPVYNPSHMLGFFSAFNSDAIKDIKLYAGVMPARFGGRLSSLLDIRMKDGNFRKWSGSGGVGLISSRLAVEGPLRVDKSSMIISVRRTYADLFLPLIDSPELTDTKLNFYDLNAKFNTRVNRKNTLYLSLYTGSDVFSRKGLFNIGWGNRTATLRWNHLVNERLFSNTSLIYSNFNYRLGVESRQTTSRSTSGIEDYNLKTDFVYFVSSDMNTSLGVNAIAHHFNPGTIENPASLAAGIPQQFAMEYAAYLSNEHWLGDAVVVEYGVRYSTLQNIGAATVYRFDERHNLADSIEYGSGVYNTSGGLEPRFKVKTETHAGIFSLSYGRMRQYIHRLSNYTGSFSSPEIWMASGPNIKPQISDQVAISFTRSLTRGITSSVDVYYKKMMNVIDYKDHAVLALNPFIEGQIRSGQGRAYGAEFQLQKNSGQFTGWIAYVLSKTERKVSTVNDGKYFPARFDRPHAITTSMSYKLNTHWQFSANWTFMTGEAITVPVASYEYGGKSVPIYSDRNAYRLPSYHRLDLAANLIVKSDPGKKVKSSWSFSVYNAYFRKNAYSINYNRLVDQFGNVVDGPLFGGGQQVIATHKATTKTYLFGIVPSVTYNFTF